MPRLTLILLLFAVATLATLWAGWGASRVAASKEDPRAWIVGLTGAALLMNLILLMNALAFVDWATIRQAEVLGRGTLLQDQLWLLGGTAGLMVLVAGAIDTREVRAAPDPGTAFGRAYSGMIERLLVRFWWAALGLGLLFGFRARGVALLLALELTLVWAAGKVALLRARGAADAVEPAE